MSQGLARSHDMPLRTALRMPALSAAWLAMPLGAVPDCCSMPTRSPTCSPAACTPPKAGRLAPYARAARDGDVFWRVMSITLTISAIVTGACLLLALPARPIGWRKATTGAGPTCCCCSCFDPVLDQRAGAVLCLDGAAGAARHPEQPAALPWAPSSGPIRMLNTRFAVCLAMVHVLLPFMVLPLYATLRALDWQPGACGAEPGRHAMGHAAPGGVPAGPARHRRRVSRWCSRCPIGFYITPVLGGRPLPT